MPEIEQVQLVGLLHSHLYAIQMLLVYKSGMFHPSELV